MRRHVPALDGIRGTAVLAVMAFHLGRLDGGYLGVDAFFVLSGFLITSLLLGERDRSGRVDLGAFWERRARRLLPALLVALAVVGFVSWAVASPADASRVRGDGLATLLYVANWHAIWSGHGYFALFANPSPLDHTWSLAIEEQCYVLWPLVVVGVLGLGRHRAARKRLLLGVAVAGAVASTVLMAVLARDGQGIARVYDGTDTRAAAILIGAALAVGWSIRPPADGPSTRRRLLEGAALVAVAGLAWAWVRVDGQTLGLYKGGLALAGVGVATVIAAAAHPHGGPLSRLFAFGPLAWVGKISYGLYLWHWPLDVWLTPERTGLNGIALDGLRTATAFAAAVASFHLIERPVRERRWRVRTVVAAGPVAAVVATVALVLVPVVVSTSPARTAVATTPTTPPGTVGTGPGTVPGAGATAPTARPRILIAGDSVALSVVAGIQDSPDLGVEVKALGFLGCGAVHIPGGQARLGDGRRVTEAADCQSGNGRWAPDVQAFRPDVAVLLAGAWDLLDHRLNGRWAHVCEPEYDALVRRDLTSAVDALRAGGGPVLLSEIPYPRAKKITGDDAQANQRTDCYNAAIRDVAAATGAGTFDFAALACPTGPDCVTVVDGATLRPDGVHYDGPGGIVAAHWIVPRVLASVPR